MLEILEKDAPEAYLPELPAGDVLHDSDRVRILHAPGSSDDAGIVLSFTGLAHKMGGMHRAEFVRSIANQAIQREVYYISDKTLSWYNQCGPEIVAALQPLLAGRRFFTLGNSMGGFGAILFAHLLEGCAGALAFVPQYRIDPALEGHEPRWPEHLGRIRHFPYPTCVPAVRQRPPCLIVAGTADPFDRVHVRGLLADPGCCATAIMIEGCGHHAGKHLQMRHALSPLLDAAMAWPGQPQPVQAALRQCGVAHHVLTGPMVRQ